MADTRTLGNMIDRIAAELQRDDLGSSSDPLLTNQASIYNAILDGVYDYQRESFFISDYRDETITTIAGQTYYDIPTNLVSVTQLDIIGNNVVYPLLLREMQIIDTWDSNAQFPVQGMPVYYAFYANQFRCFPTPDRGTVLSVPFGTDCYTFRVIYKGRLIEPTDVTTSNFWTTSAESLIRNRAKYTINMSVIRDANAAALDKQAEMDAFRRIMIETAGKLFTRELKATIF